MPTTTPWASALLDLARAGWAELLRWLDRRTPLELAAALVALAALAVLVRRLRAWRARRPTLDGWTVEPPLPCFVRLAGGLRRLGLERADHEPVEALARRVRRSPLPAGLRDCAAGLLDRYAALRYGGGGDPAELDADVDSLLEQLGDAVPQP